MALGGIVYLLYKQTSVRNYVVNLKQKTIYHLFISHSWDYKSSYNNLISLLNSDDDFEFKDYSVPIERALDFNTIRELEQKLENKIQRCHVIIFIAGMYYTHRNWMIKEFKIARSKNKPIICVIPWGQERVPKELKDMSDYIVGWNSNSIIQTIEEAHMKSQK